MEYVEPEKRRLNLLLFLDSFLTKFFVLILALLSVFVVKFFLSAMNSVEKAGIPLDSVIDIIKYHFTAFFDSFGDLTCKYMLFVSMLLFINVVGITANKFLKVFGTRAFYVALFALSIVIVFNLPIEKIYLDFIRSGKPMLLVFCLVMMILSPYILGMCFGKDKITFFIYAKIFYVLIYGLLLIQLFIEW